MPAPAFALILWSLLTCNPRPTTGGTRESCAGVAVNHCGIADGFSSMRAERGHGTSSFRMYEALQLLTVPVYIWVDDRTLPYEEIIDWKDIAVVLNGGELKHLRNRIDSFDVGHAQKLIQLYRYYSKTAC